MTRTRDPRAPQAFTMDDVRFPDQGVSDAAAGEQAADAVDPAPSGSVVRPSWTARRFGWGALFFSAAAALSSLALGLWFTRFVSVALERQDWLGWTATVLLGAMALAAAVIVGREALGFWRLARLGHLKQDAARALREGDAAGERRTVRRIIGLLSSRPELQWPLARMREHEAGVRDPGDLFRLTDRDLLAPLDNDARRLVTRAAKRVSVATAMSPAALFAVLWVLVENVRLIRGLATLYGGRPGLLGTARLARMVFTHLVATGGVALTDDLLGQFLGQDLLRRLSRRLGEGIFNGALTARIGTAAIEVTRPLPFIEARPVRARDFLLELTRRRETAAPPGAKAASDGERRP
jgi:putative membrane protein